ncbi:MAG: M23 family metallopeptidase, partial [bacterium]
TLAFVTLPYAMALLFSSLHVVPGRLFVVGRRAHGLLRRVGQPVSLPGRVLALTGLLLASCAAPIQPGPALLEVPIVALPTKTPTPVATATPIPTATPSPSPSPTPTPTPIPVPPGLEIEPEVLPQGGVALIRVRSDQPLSVSGLIDQRALAWAKDDRGYWTVAGLGSYAAVGSHPVQVTATDGGGNKYSMASAITVRSGGFPVDHINLPPDRAVLLDPKIVAEEEAKLAAIFRPFEPARLWEGAFLKPAVGETTAGFGEGRSYQGGPVSSRHQGWDIGAFEGDTVIAGQSGRVVFAGPLNVRGNTIIISHGMGVYSSYNHLSTISIELGTKVRAGDRIALVGNTGLSTGAHLHWEMTVGGVPVDPVPLTKWAIAP